MKKMKTQNINKLFYILLFVYILTVGCCHLTVNSYAEEYKEEHRYRVEIIKKADKDSDGLRRYTCEDCGYTYTEIIPATGHRWSEWIIDVEPTYEKAGHMYRVCNKYSHLQHYEEKEIPPLKREEPNKNTEEEVLDNSKQLINNLKSDSKKEIIPTVDETSDQNNTKITEAMTIKDIENTDKVRGGLFSGPVNYIDYISAGAMFMLVPYYIIIILPLIKLLIWIRRKRKEAKEK